MNKNIIILKIENLIKNIIFIKIENDMKYKLIFSTVIMLFSYFFIIENIILINKEKLELSKVKAKIEESFLRKVKLEEKMALILKGKDKSEEKKENKQNFIYENASIFKIDLENMFKELRLKHLSSSRMEKQKIIKKEEIFYEIKIYYELLGEIEDFKQLFFLSEKEPYIIGRENFIMNFTEEDEKKIKVKMKINFFSYETSNGNTRSINKFKKITQKEQEEIKVISLRNTLYYILESENNKRRMVKKEKEQEKVKEEVKVKLY